MAKKPVPHQHPYGERISLELAKEMAEAGEAFATEMGWNATIAICDDGGNLVLLHRMSNGQFGSLDLAPPKARAPALPDCPPKLLTPPPSLPPPVPARSPAPAPPAIDAPPA